MEVIRIGCGAGYQGDRIAPAVELLKCGELDFLVLECLAERTLAQSVERMQSGGIGYDPRLNEWMSSLLPLIQQNSVKLITNMGAADPIGAGQETKRIANELNLALNISVVYETTPKEEKQEKEVICTYLGAEGIVDALSSGADVVITGRVADPSLFVACAVYSFGWNLQKDLNLIAKATLLGHLLECGTQLTGGYFAHPCGKNISLRDLEKLFHLSCPFADIDKDGNLVFGKLLNTGGELSVRTCKEQLLYEIGDPSSYITPDVIVDFSGVTFYQITPNAVLALGGTANSRPTKLLQLVASRAGFKGWGEMSWGGKGCLLRAYWADQQVRHWMEETKKNSSTKVLSYLLGYNSLYFRPLFPDPTLSLEEKERHLLTMSEKEPPEVRLRMDGLFESKEEALVFTSAFQGLVLSGPAGGGGFSWNIVPEVKLSKKLVDRDSVLYQIEHISRSVSRSHCSMKRKQLQRYLPLASDFRIPSTIENPLFSPSKNIPMKLYEIAHCRAGDKGNTVNVGIIPYDERHFDLLKQIITKEWVLRVFEPLFTTSEEPNVQIFPVQGIKALNIVVSPVLDGGVTVSRRIDRHGKTLSDLVLNETIEWHK